MRLALILAAALSACSQPSVGQPAPLESFPKPDRPVAEIVSPVWSSGPDRDKADESGQVVRALAIGPGMAVADIGAGSGYHTIRLSPVVGPAGLVYAEDVMESYMADLRADVERRGLANVRLVVGTADDPKLPAHAVDRAILVHMYHEVRNPYALMWNLVPALKPGALVGVVDLDRRPERHGTPPALLKCEVEAVGYRQVSFQLLAGGIGYIAVFAPPAPEDRPAPGAIRPCAIAP